MGNVTTVHNQECHASEESSDDIDVNSPNGVMKTETDYSLTNRPDMVTYVTVINPENIGRDHIMATRNTKLDIKVDK